jgi:hypothetical protein
VLPTSSVPVDAAPTPTPPADRYNYNYDDSDSNPYAVDYGDGDRGDYGPIVLDLTGAGIKITQKTSSNTFFDTTGDAYQNLTSWAGVGNGVLFVDTTGTGALTQANQMIFTDWDPSATSDMQALEFAGDDHVR